MIFRKKYGALLLGVLVLLGGCAKTATLPKNASAEAIFEAAETDMRRRLYPEAIKGFEQVRIRHPYSQLAPTATLKSGDCHLKAGEPLEAIESYRLFLQLYPRHNEVPYATYRIGEAHMERAPKDYWFMPPIYEKDLAPIKQGVNILQEFLKKYSASTYREKAQAILEKGQGRLIDHELYVAEFNYKRQYYGAALSRAMALVDNYPGHPLDAKAYLMAAKSSAYLGKYEDGEALAQLVIANYPATKEAAKAQELLRQMPKVKKTVDKREAKKAAKLAKERAKEEKKQAKEKARAAKKEAKAAAKNK